MWINIILTANHLNHVLYILLKQVAKAMINVFYTQILEIQLDILHSVCIRGEKIMEKLIHINTHLYSPSLFIKLLRSYTCRAKRIQLIHSNVALKKP